MDEKILKVKEGDVVMVTDRSWLSKMIRFFTRSPGEKPSRVSHVAIVSKAGTVADAEIIEAAPTGIIRRPLRDHVGRPCVVYRRRFYDPGEKIPAITRAKMSIFAMPDYAAARAGLMVGNVYPWWRLIAHVLDWLLFDLYLFRRVMRSSAQMECSYLVAWSYGSSITDRPSWAVTPDDLDDWMAENDDVWTVVAQFQILKLDAVLGLRLNNEGGIK